MRGRLVLLIVALTASSLVPSPALGIVNGEPDAGRHPNVGVFAFGMNNNQSVNPVCSGTLIAPDVFLTAGHCTDTLDWAQGLGILSGVWVTFDEVYGPDPFHPDRTNWVPVMEWHAHPDVFYANGQLTFNDIAVLILDLDNKPAHVVMPAPAALPAAGLLDGLAARGGLRRRTFTAVGYGYSRTFEPGPPAGQYQIFPIDRSVALSEFRALTPDLIYLSQNPALGDGGICYGDSGGAYFLKVGGSEVLAALTSAVDVNCRAWGGGFRIDTEAARSFLQQFVSLP